MEESNSEKSKRIAKNTIYLYLRTFIVILISLFTSRVILHTLGATDFGIYNLVGGVVVLFTFINSAMTASTQRFLNYEVGQNKRSSIMHIFSTSLMIHICIALAIFILAETVGLWFLINKLNIPEGRETAAFWVYQFAILTTCMNTIRCPYNAAIIAFEKMNFFARISIVEALLKLLIACVILYCSVDKLVIYSILLFIATILINYIYKRYCDNNFTAIRFRYKKDIAVMKSMLGFSIWNLMGTGAIMVSNQGIAMLLNIFYSVIVNAALGLANQVNIVVTTMVSNFQTAFMPQITKSYAKGEMDYFTNLIYITSRYSFLLFFIIAYPVFFNSDTVLSLWLGAYPEYTSGFVKVVVLCVAFDALSGPLWMAVHAKGRIRNYQIIVSVVLLLTMLACFIAIKAGASPVFAYATRIILLLILYIFRVLYIKFQIGLNLRRYLVSVLLRNAIILVIGVGTACIIDAISMNSIFKIIIYGFVGMIIVLFIGLTTSERSLFLDKIKKTFIKFT